MIDFDVITGPGPTALPNSAPPVEKEKVSPRRSEPLAERPAPTPASPKA